MNTSFNSAVTYCRVNFCQYIEYYSQYCYVTNYTKTTDLMVHGKESSYCCLLYDKIVSEKISPKFHQLRS